MQLLERVQLVIVINLYSTTGLCSVGSSSANHSRTQFNLLHRWPGKLLLTQQP